MEVRSGGERRLYRNAEKYCQTIRRKYGKIAGAYFFNGKEYGRGSKILYPNFKEMDFKIGVAFAKDASSLKLEKITDYNMEIEECQNISMREDMETIENILESGHRSEKRSCFIGF